MKSEFEDFVDEPMETRQQHRKMKMNRSGLSLTQEQKFELIDHIHQRPHIWDHNTEGFRSNNSRQNAFTEVAQLLSNNEESFTRIQVQEEWGKLRYCFTRIVKKLLEEAPDGKISEEQLATISWAFFRRMGFLLGSVIQQLHGPSGQQQQLPDAAGIDGTEGGGDWAAVQLVNNQQENMQSDHHSPLHTKIRRHRRHHNNANNDISNELSRKSNHEFVAVEMDDGNANHLADNSAPLNQSTNELLMRQVLGLNAPDLMANAMSTSQQLLQHFQQSAEQMKPKREIGEGEENTSEGDGISIVSLINDPVMPSRNLRRKRRGTNLDFLLGTVAQQQQNQQVQRRRLDQQVAPPIASSTPAKQPTTSASSFLTNGIGGDIMMNGRNHQSSPMNRIIVSNLSTKECSQIRENNMARSSPNAVVQKQQKLQQQQKDGMEEKTTMGELMMENGGDAEHNGGEFAGSNARGGGGKGDIIDSFGLYIVQQLRTVHKKSEMLSVEMRKALVNLCFDFEMRACKIATPDNKNDDKASMN